LLVADVNEGIAALSDTLKGLREEQWNGDKRILILVNKTDNDPDRMIIEFENSSILRNNEQMLFISAMTGSGIADLKIKLGEMSGLDLINDEGVIITNIRHYEALSKVTESLERVLSGLNEKLPEDLIAIDVRQAIHYLGEITGEITSDEILGNIFRNFCIGK
jgi:tRNA modification GTPase